MQNKNVDDLNKPGIKKLPLSPKAPVRVDSIVARPQMAHQKPRGFAYNKPSLSVKKSRPKFFTQFGFVKNLYTQKRVPVLVAVVALLIAFGGGVWATLDTSKSAADNQPQVLGASTQTPALAVQPSSPLGQIGNLPDNVMFNMTLNQLEDYLNKVAETNQKQQQAQILAQRTKLLRAYLEEKNSPLAAIADTIAGLKHWQLVLAISNSESSLGRHCSGQDNNCSGIGVAPGNPLWHTYASKAEWAKDLDKLIEKRYKGWSLEQMNGTYNKPGSDNWILAAKQILEDLQARNIE